MKLRRRDPGQRVGQEARVDLAVFSADSSQLDTAAEETGRICLGSIDVCNLAAIDDAPGRAERGERQGIGGGPCGDRKNPHRGLEQVGKALLQIRRPLVGAVTQRSVVIGPNRGLEDLGRCPSGVVAAIIDHRRRICCRARNLYPFLPGPP